jgi:hypothetical protein
MDLDPSTAIIDRNELLDLIAASEREHLAFVRTVRRDRPRPDDAASLRLALGIAAMLAGLFAWLIAALG